MNDLLADGITRIRNGILRGLEIVELKNSKIVREVLRVLKEEGFILDFEVNAECNCLIKVTLKYFKNKSVINEIRKVSKCSCRVYSGITTLKKSRSNFGVFVLSTNKGVLSHMEAKKANVGGEILVEVF
jgi:small subunit ribosomal protein S8